MFLPGLRTLIPDGALWNGGILQGQKRTPIFTHGSKFGGDTDVLYRSLSLQLHFRLKEDCRELQTKIFAILKAIVAIAGRPTSDAESYMIFVDS